MDNGRVDWTPKSYHVERIRGTGAGLGDGPCGLVVSELHELPKHPATEVGYYCYGPRQLGGRSVDAIGKSRSFSIEV